jgi:hypothetical protein
MKIAVLLYGNIRSWNICRENFIKTFTDNENEVDVFIHTCNKLLNYNHYIKDNYKIFDDLILTDDDIVNRINIPYKQLTIEPQTISLEKNHYDIIVKTRFDILFNITLTDILPFVKEHNTIYTSDNSNKHVMISKTDDIDNLLNTDNPLKTIKPLYTTIVRTNIHGTRSWSKQMP